MYLKVDRSWKIVSKMLAYSKVFSSLPYLLDLLHLVLHDLLLDHWRSVSRLCPFLWAVLIVRVLLLVQFPKLLRLLHERFLLGVRQHLPQLAQVLKYSVQSRCKVEVMKVESRLRSWK